MRLPALIAFVASVTGVFAICPDDSLQGSLDPDGGCICPSGFGGNQECMALDLSLACPDGLPKASEMSSTSLQELIELTLPPTHLLSFTLAMPMGAGRQYTQVGVTGPSFNSVSEDCTADQVFPSFTTAAPSEGCVENWDITATMSNLLRCGFTLSMVWWPGSELIMYDGNVRVAFEEPVEVGTGSFAQNITRSVTVDYPTRISFESGDAVLLNIGNVTVAALQQLDFAIIGMPIFTDKQGTPAPPNITAIVKYTVQFPYAIVSWGTKVETTAPITAAISELTEAQICNTDADYTVDDTAGTNTCVKSDNTLTFETPANNPETCKFDNYEYKLGFSVNCAQGLDALDCPLAGDDTSGYVTFTVSTTTDFCPPVVEEAPTVPRPVVNSNGTQTDNGATAGASDFAEFHCDTVSQCAAAYACSLFNADGDYTGNIGFSNEFSPMAGESNDGFSANDGATSNSGFTATGSLVDESGAAAKFARAASVAAAANSDCASIAAKLDTDKSLAAACTTLIAGDVFLPENNDEYFGTEGIFAQCDTLADGSGSECPPSCKAVWRGDGVCDEACNNKQCKFDFGDCCPSDSCRPAWIKNGRCDEACNIAACQFDGNDCSGDSTQ